MEFNRVSADVCCSWTCWSRLCSYNRRVFVSDRFSEAIGATGDGSCDAATNGDVALAVGCEATDVAAVDERASERVNEDVVDRFFSYDDKDGE